MHILQDIIKNHKKNGYGGIYSVCSSHPLVIEAAAQYCKENNSYLLLEATSNQVNQFGGYTGYTPRTYRKFALDIIAKVGLSHNKVILGGDHLGPNAWQDDDSDVAMAKAEQLVCDYVTAGFTKIHLDCSMSCKNDPIPLSDATIASRAARLCVACETAANEVGREKPVYIIGTEVPVPGGASDDLMNHMHVTTVKDAQNTLDIHEKEFAYLNLEEAFNRVIGLVVQPGVEFDHTQIYDYKPKDAQELSQFCSEDKNWIFEAHSTDYQQPKNLKQLVKDHFAILKVGPALTFAMREAIFALGAIEKLNIPTDKQSHIEEVVENIMLKNPKNWQKYYEGSSDQQLFARKFSLSDRIRYYWNFNEVEQALERLFKNLDQPIALPLISQYFPDIYWDIRTGKVKADGKSLVLAKIMGVCQQYQQACEE
ncbi:MAG: D-tagatose-bisphosphate aldolase, class II, non-catalytic subunit [Alphaproteobacteria bacterium]